MKIVGAQLNLIVGDLEGNRDRVLEAMAAADDLGADLLLTPELAITGYPPEDLVHRGAFVDRNLEILAEIAAGSGSVATVVGFVDRVDGSGRRPDGAPDRGIANAAALVAGGEIKGRYYKSLLPNYGVFDEARYFVPGPVDGRTFDVGGVAVGLTICEDIWVVDGPAAAQCATGADLLVNINGSPFHIGKGEQRAELLAGHAARFGVPIVYVNLVGGQDELVFDGQSMAFDAAGELIHRSPQFEEDIFGVEIGTGDGVGRPGALAPDLGEEEAIYRALSMALADYVRKNGFSGVVVGLSGGIDSALTAAIATDALGASAVWGIAMPGPYNAPSSESDAAELAANLGIRFDVVGIGPTLDTYLAALADVFAGKAPDVTEENLQARIRGAILMAVSNKHGPMVVATGNKSEMAVGYATLYGDMVGGYAVLKDVSKTLVYRLARWRNRSEAVIPEAIIDKPPSAELRPGQLDSDSLPPYEILDAILERYIEEDEGPAAIAAAGFDAETVSEVVAMVDRNEYKRRQAAPGVKITEKAFGRDRRPPITHRFEG